MSGAVGRRLNLPLQMVKNHLRVEVDEDDALIQDYIESAKQEADDYLGNDFERDIERVGRGDGVTLQFPLKKYPVFKVNSVKVDGSTLSDPHGYSVVKSTGIITFVEAPEEGDLIEVDYEAEFPIPERVRNWVLSRVAYKYEHRTQAVTSQTDGSGSVAWAPPDYSELWQLRSNPGF